MLKTFDKKITTALIFLIFLLGSLWFLERSHKLPHFSSDTIFYLGTQKDESGQLMTFDPSIEKKHVLSKKNEVVNQFILYESSEQRYIFFFSVPKKDFSDAHSIQENQKLYMLELSTGKKREITKPKNAQFSTIYPEIINDKIFFEAKNHIYYYSLRQKKWGSLYENIPLQDIALSETSQLLIGANPLENFGFTLLPLAEEMAQSNPIGNYFQNLGFSPDGKKILFKQKPDQDIFSSESYLNIFNSDGTSQEILKNKGEIVQAHWVDNENIIALFRDESFLEKTILLNINSPNTFTTILESESIQWIGLNKNKLWIVDEYLAEEMNHDQETGIKGLLDSFAERKIEYHIWSYDIKNEQLHNLQIQGFFPTTF